VGLPGGAQDGGLDLAPADGELDEVAVLEAELGGGGEADEGGVVPSQLGDGIGGFLKPAVVRETTVVDGTARGEDHLQPFGMGEVGNGGLGESGGLRRGIAREGTRR